MNQLFHQLVERKAYLEALQEEIVSSLEHSPKGKLRVSNDKGIPRYYHVTGEKDTRGKYISKKQQGLALQLGQKDYMEKLHQKVREELEDIDKYLLKHGECDLENVFLDLNVYRKNIVKPMVVPDEMFVAQWRKETYESNPYRPEEKVYVTKREETVRSKSELLLADMYHELDIPYRYEAVLRLKNGSKKYPDFTILKVNTREIIYHEHFGLMDDDDYRRQNFMKLDEYRDNGIYPGKNLIITYEVAGCYLNIKEIKKMIKEILERK